MSRETISKTRHISESFISDGTKELRKQNLLHIQYGNLEGKSYDQRLANIYTPENLYDPEELQNQIKILEQKHGIDKVKRALQIASIVFEQNNTKTIEILIDLEDKYGQQTIEEAAQKIAQKNPDNPKRSTGYLINTIKSIAQQKETNTK